MICTDVGVCLFTKTVKNCILYVLALNVHHFDLYDYVPSSNSPLTPTVAMWVQL